MFKLESYITPILLSYVDKYIKNFRPEDSQVSLWGGEVSFHNLDLRLEVLEEELQLPFSFVSGHIHELLIHVPWTKLASEPITITINTIECILKLKAGRSSDCASSSSSGASNSNRERRKAATKKEEIENPPGYIQSVVNKIVGNIAINCNNLILKYVEEDIVVSMNIKLLTVESADEEWKPAFTELSATQVLIRKLITLTDLTVCLDRRNAAGKIDVYQEPMLYRCSLEIRFLRKYHTATAKQTSTTRVDVHCNSMEFSMTSQQFPMLMRLVVLVQTLQSRELKKERMASPHDSVTGEDANTDASQEIGWAGWAWSLVPSILPTWDEDATAEHQAVSIGHTTHIGAYVDNALFSFKVSESSSEKTYYAPRKLKYWPILSLRLQGCMFQSITHNVNWTNCQVGVAKMSLLPSGDCVCGADEVTDNTQPQEYFKSLLNPTTCHFNDSLLDSNSFENKGEKRAYNLSWDDHMTEINDQYLLSKSPALSIDFLHHFEVPQDFPVENLQEFSVDLEYSNFKERSLTRIFVGPFSLKYSAGLIHRLSMLQQASELYDYQPYFETKSTPSLSELPPPSSEDYDALVEYIPIQETEITFVRPSIEFVLWDHVPNTQTKKRHQSFSSLGETCTNSKDLPKLCIETENIIIKTETPTYPNRLVYTTCKLPNPPKSLLESCYSKSLVDCNSVKLSLIIKDKTSTLLNPMQIVYSRQKILLKKYWQDKDICLEDLSIRINTVNITSTKARLMIASYIADSMINHSKDALLAIYDSTLLMDSYMDARVQHLEFVFEHIYATRSLTICTQSYHLTLETCKAFIIEPMLIKKDKEATYTYESSELGDILLKTMSKSVKIRMTETFNMNQSQQVIVLSGPEVEMKGSQMVHNSNILLSLTVQLPNKKGVPDHPALVLFNLSEFRVSLDPLLCRWLQYKPKKFLTRRDKINIDPGSVRRRRCSEASGASLETPRRIGPQPTSVHSSSEPPPRSQSIPIRSLSPPPPELQQGPQESQWFKTLLDWHVVWKSLLIIGDLNQITLYCPTNPVPALGAQNLQGAYLNNMDINPDLEIFVLRLPYCSLRSANQRQKLDAYALCYPIKLPDHIWTENKKSFPWSISIWDFQSYTVCNNKMHLFIKPVACNATISVTTKTYRRKSADSIKNDLSMKDSRSENITDLRADNRSPSNRNSDHSIPLGKVPSLVEMFNKNSNTSLEQNTCTTEDQVCSLSVCVYIDTMPIVICMSEPQVALLSSIALGLLELSANMASNTGDLKFPNFPRSPNPTTPTDILFKESTRGSTISGPSHSVDETDSECSPKFSIFVQWTLTRFSIKIYGTESTTQLKLLLDVEDIVNSLDMQSIYVKLKSKIATAGIRHFRRDAHTKRWINGPYLGIVMKVRENGNTSSEENVFASITFTRARCGNVHNRWGTIKKSRYREKSVKPIAPRVRYLSELMVTMQSVDIVLSPKTLSNFLLVLHPLSEVSMQNDEQMTCIPLSTDPGNFQNLAVLNLPLMYLDIRGLRLIIPSSDSSMRMMHQDVYILQIIHINLNPTPDNPICRVPLRPDLYQQAAQAGFLNIPGSEMEDRQYQLTASSFNISTCVWSQLKHCLSVENNDFNLRTMNENPALEWNNLDSKKSALSPHVSLTAVVNKFDLCVVAAPAMVHGTTIICGHAVEINCISDVDVNVSIDQVKLAQSLAEECSQMMTHTTLEETKRSNTRVYPYARTTSQMVPTDDNVVVNEIQFESNIVTTSPLDSGVDIGDFNSENVTLSKINSSISETIDEYTLFTKKFNEKPILPLYDIESFIPFELLFTGGTVSIAFYQNHRTTRSHESFGSSSGNMMIMYEKGYEASEEDFQDEGLAGQSITQPLMRLVIQQPNSLISKTAFDNRFQISVFDIRLDISVMNAIVDKHTPQPNDYRLILIETKQGELNPGTGIAPALATIRWTSGIGKAEDLDITLARPIKVHFSMDRWLHLHVILKKIMYCAQNDDDMYAKSVVEQHTETLPFCSPHPPSAYTKFTAIKSKTHGIGHLNVNTTQIVFNIKSMDNDEINLSLSKLKTKLVIRDRPEKIQSTVNVEGLSLNLVKQNSTLLLLHPWTFEIYANLFWESWQNVEDDCLIQLNADSDCFMLAVGPEHIKVLQKILKEYDDIFDELTSDSRYTVVQADEDLALVETAFSESSENTKGPSHTDQSHAQDQHYKDDLRAGAFQFVDASIGEEIPLPYQVLFWSSIQGTGTMSWRYPQPRLLTKVHIYPVPFQVNPEDSSNITVYCQLEYYSEVHGSFLPYSQFTLSESKMLRLNMPIHIPEATCSSVWRVQMSSTNFESNRSFKNKRPKADRYSRENLDFGLLVGPRALAACMRIDSFFSASLIPRVKTVLKFSSVQINIHNHLDLSRGFMMPQSLKDYQINTISPMNQEVITLSLDATKAYFCRWTNESQLINVDASIKCTVLDYGFLTTQTLLEPLVARLNFSQANMMSMSVVSKPIIIKFGPSIAHTLAVTEQLWTNSFLTPQNADVNGQNMEMLVPELVIMTRYVICNDTNFTLRFGQSATEENIVLPPNTCNYYAWRSHKRKHLLRVGIIEHDQMWSEIFGIEKCGRYFVKFDLNPDVILLVNIEMLSATQKKVTFCGQLTIYNMSMEVFDLKVYPAHLDKSSIAELQSHTLLGKNKGPSLVVNSNEDLCMRLRFQGLDSYWSGDIPLKENSRNYQPWLVKVPLQEKGQFLCIWCKIFTEDENNVCRSILIVLWPLYMIRSHLPMSTKVQIDTPALNVHLQTDVEGRGTTKQLYCPGTVDHSHQLTFQIEMGLPASNPYVPLSYSLIDQKQFFEMDSSSIDCITKLLEEQLVQKSQWPFLGEEFPHIDWIAMDQPQTNVTVRYQSTGPSSCTLLLELLPWCIMLNTSGLHLSVYTYNQEMSQLPHHGVLTPPKLENTFTIQVYVDDAWHVSNPLQFSEHVKASGGFYMPKITGLIPQEGSIKTAVPCNLKVCNISINSMTKHDIRIVHISSSHVAYNATDQPFKLITFALRLDSNIIPRELPMQTEISLQPAGQMRGMGVPITEWYNLSYYDGEQSMTSINSADYGFFICISAFDQTTISCPIRVDTHSIRRSTTVPCDGYSIPLLITTQQHKGQIYITLQYDVNPQLLIVNESYLKLLCAQATPESISGHEDPTPIHECPELCVFQAIPVLGCTYYTMPYVNNNFPEIQNANAADSGLIFAVANDGEVFWCQPISVTSKTVMCIPLPGFGDIKITVTPYCYTTTVVIQTVSEIEISAREIRSRLSYSGSDTTILSESKSALINLPKSSGMDQSSVEDEASSIDTTPTQSASVVTSESRLPVMVRNSPLPRLVSAVIENSRPSMRHYALPTIQESDTKLQQYIPPDQEFSESSFDFRSREDTSRTNIRGSTFFNSITLGLFLKSLTLVLMTDVDDSGMDKTEMAAFIFDEFAVTISPCPEEVNVHISMSNMQIDNQLFNRGDYDFPVVMLGQKNEKLDNENFCLTTRIYELIANSRNNSLISLRLDFEVFDNVHINSIGIKDVTMKVDSISMYIEDSFFSVVLNYMDKLSPANLVVQPHRYQNYLQKPCSTYVWIPEKILVTSKVLGRPLKVNRLTIYPIDLLLSVHSSIRMYIALDHSPLHFGTFERKNILTTHFKLGHSLAMHYLSGAIFGAGWVVGSLEILGSPSGLARSVGSGLRDFVQKPYEGMFQGPWGFLVGIAQGSTSLMKHITAGTVNSLSKMAASVARNLDRLTLDTEHFQRTEELRRIRPQGFSQGILHGLTGLGISILGAVGGIAHHPLNADSASGMVAGVGLGLVGAIAKPISGAAELVALAGQGLLHGTGWHILPQARNIPVVRQSFCFNNANLKYIWKILPSLLGGLDLLYVTEGTCITQSGSYEAVALVLTLQALIIFDLEEDACQREIALTELQGSPDSGDPTLICFRIIRPDTPIATASKMDIPTMDPSCRARVAQYIHYANTLNAPLHNISDNQSDTSISSQLQTPTESDDSFGKHSKVIFYINPQTRNHFLSIFTLAKKQKEGLGFPVF